MLLTSFPNLWQHPRVHFNTREQGGRLGLPWGLTLTHSRLPSTWTAPEVDSKVLSPWERVCREAFLNHGSCSPRLHRPGGAVTWGAGIACLLHILDMVALTVSSEPGPRMQSLREMGLQDRLGQIYPKLRHRVWLLSPGFLKEEKTCIHSQFCFDDWWVGYSDPPSHRKQKQSKSVMP